MEQKKYAEIVKKITPKEKRLKNGIIAFLVGGLMGIIAQGLIDLYISLFSLSTKQASVFMIITLIFLGCLFTGLAFFDKWVSIAKCGLIIPITGFAHAIMSSTLEYKKEGLVTGIGSNMLKLVGSVIIYGIISAYIFGLIRFLIGGNI